MFGVKEKFKTQAGEATNKDVWKHLKVLALANCSCMQGDKDALNFCYSLRKNKKIEKSKFSKNKKGWYSEPFSPQTTEVKESFDGKLAAKKPKLNASPANFNCENCPVLQVSISQLQKYPTLKTSECSELHSYLCSEREFFSVGETKRSWQNF